VQKVNSENVRYGKSEKTLEEISDLKKRLT